MFVVRFISAVLLIFAMSPLVAHAGGVEYRHGRYDTTKPYTDNVRLLTHAKETLNGKYQRLSTGKDSLTSQDIVIGANDGVIYHLGFLVMGRFIAHDDDRSMLALEKEFGLDGRTRVVMKGCGYDFPCTDIFYGCRGAPSSKSCVFQVQSMTSGKDSRTGIIWRRLVPHA
jgi:hypothetical protein